MDEYIIVVFGQYLAMGKFEVDPTQKGFQLVKPRALNIVQDRGNVGVQFLPFLGDPEYIYIGSETNYYFVKDRELIKGYVQATTGLVIADSKLRPIRN